MTSLDHVTPHVTKTLLRLVTTPTSLTGPGHAHVTPHVTRHVTPHVTRHVTHHVTRSVTPHEDTPRGHPT